MSTTSTRHFPFLALASAALSFLPGIARAEDTFNVVEDEKAITITRGAGENAVPVLTYHKAKVAPPAGAPDAFSRSGFIHPLCAPSGEPVTGIHPPDHLHHIGLWHAWVDTVHGGRKLDFWNLLKGEGTVQYAKTLALHREGDDGNGNGNGGGDGGGGGAGFTVLQNHVALGKDGAAGQTILQEKFTIKIRLAEGTYIVDHDTEQTNVTDQALELPAYRYGGCIAYRAPNHWDKTNSDYLTSEGKNRDNGHTTRGRWCAMFGPTAKGDATVAILCHPGNHDAPQRMRIWPPDTNNGAIFFNYVPIQETGWQLEPGKPVTMRYRILVSDARPDPKAIDAAWGRYSGAK